MDTTYTDGLKRLVGRSCGFWSYRLAAENLQEYCGIHLSHTLVGGLAQKTADEIAKKLPKRLDMRNDFQQAKGETEFLTDGTCINTRNDDGKPEWREMKVGILSKRECGASAAPSEWDSRELPEPSIVSAFAAIENKEEFQDRCQAERRRLGVESVFSSLGDGALWIWSIVLMVFGKTAECLDIYHALEHVAACGKVLHGSGADFTNWLDRMRLVLLSEGFAGMDRELSLLLLGELSLGERVAVKSLHKYLDNNRERLPYFERLASGRSIGSGQVEGACKNLVGRRLKQTGACWRLERANRMAVICALLYANQWKPYWKNSP
jgi:hypothetical protein